jgi:hypothetical protein
MADHNIATPQHLLKRLEEEVRFLSDLMSELDGFVSKAENISSQAVYVSYALKRTWKDTEQAYKSWKRDTEES